jgi:hypothetical protein
VLDLSGHLLGGVHGHPVLRARPVHREGIEEAFAAVLPFLELGEDVRQMPGSVSQGVVALAKALDLLPLLQWSAIRLEETVGSLGMDLRVPEGPGIDVVLLTEALEVLENVEPRFGIGSRDAIGSEDAIGIEAGVGDRARVGTRGPPPTPGGTHPLDGPAHPTSSQIMRR